MFKIITDPQVEKLKPSDRVTRSPRHAYFMTQMPFAIQPFLIAPVLPGETLTNYFNEARLVSGPIKNSIIGWKAHQFLFYVKASDLLGDAIRDMFADPLNVDLAGTQGLAANSATFYTAKGGVPYMKLAYQKIVETYFRDEGEAWNKATVTSNGTSELLAMAQIKEGFWMDSLSDKDLVPEQAEIDASADTGDLERLLLAFEQLKALGLANLDYEDYLRAHGISVPEEADTPSKPELIASWSDFMYPANTVNPATGKASSAISTVLKKGETSRKFFKEPGFIIGISVIRPKVYFTGLAGNLAAHMSRSWDWLPNWLNAYDGTSLKKFEPGTGPLGDRTTDTDGYFVDMRDLLTYGDQFVSVVGLGHLGGNYAHLGSHNGPVPHTDGARNQLALPDASLNWKYPTQQMVEAFFADEFNNGVHTDGYTSFSIRGHQKDRTTTLSVGQ